MEQFDEEVFIYSLTSRPEDAKRYATIFDPAWLNNKTYTGILQRIYDFTKEHGTPPSLDTLSSILKDEDPQVYELRHKAPLEKIKSVQPDLSETLYVLKKARDVAVVRSMQQLTTSQGFLQAQADLRGEQVLTAMHQWIQSFSEDTTEQSMSIKEAIEDLIQHSGFDHRSEKIPTGIEPIDKWTSGGLRTRQIGILMAPTGAGKSAVLMNMAYYMASINMTDTWFITNELTMHEQTERFLSRMTGKNINLIQDDPLYAHSGLGRHWNHGLNKRLRLTSVNKQMKTDDIEAMMSKWTQISGWKPKVIVLDFMERMRPNESGYSRDASWNWLGAISEDLVRLAKRHNLLIWSAAQTNRSGLAAGILDMQMAQGSIKHFQEAASVIGMHKVSVEGEEGTDEEKIGLEFRPLKMRHSRLSTRSVILDVSLDTMYISKREIKPTVTEDNSGGGKITKTKREKKK